MLRRDGQLYRKKAIMQSEDLHFYHCWRETFQVSQVLRERLTFNDRHPLTIPNICNPILVRVLWWMNNHREDRFLDEHSLVDTAVDEWDRQYFNTLFSDVLLYVLASSELKIRRLHLMSMNRLTEMFRIISCLSVKKMWEKHHPRVKRPRGLVPEVKKIKRLFVFSCDVLENSRPIDTVVYLPSRRVDIPVTVAAEEVTDKVLRDHLKENLKCERSVKV